jgi:lipoyl(octanoyl) transferase
MSDIEWRISEQPVAYEAAVAEMEARVEAIHQGKAGELVWLLQHPALYTAGTSADPVDLLNAGDMPVFQTGRGGQYTYHGPGQRVVYVLLNLRQRGPDVRAYVHNLEAWIIATLWRFNLRGEVRDDRVGVWIDRGQGREEKIAAIGVRLRRWVSYHGIAINLNPDLSHYDGIVPCGIAEHGVTSFEALGLTTSMAELDAELRHTFVQVFG